MVYLDDDPTLPVSTARGLEAGDVRVVNGQSNAVAGYALAEVDRDSFLRGYNPQQGWHLLKFGNSGEWAGRAASVLSQRHDVPIAVFNFAVGAQRVDYFLPQAVGGGNFLEARDVLTGAGLAGHARFLC